MIWWVVKADTVNNIILIAIWRRIIILEDGSLDSLHFEIEMGLYSEKYNDINSEKFNVTVVTVPSMIVKVFTCRV